MGIPHALGRGADPYVKEPDRPEYAPDPEEDNSALELAAWFGHLDIFKMKAIRLDPHHEVFRNLMRNACHNDSADLLKMLLEKGFSPRDMDDKGSSLIRSLLLSMDWNFDPFSFTRQKKDIDTSRSREKIKMIHMLARNGARWEPSDRYDINEARRTFLKMIPDYVMEFI